MGRRAAPLPRGSHGEAVLPDAAARPGRLCRRRRCRRRRRRCRRRRRRAAAVTKMGWWSRCCRRWVKIRATARSSFRRTSPSSRSWGITSRALRGWRARASAAGVEDGTRARARNSLGRGARAAHVVECGVGLNLTCANHVILCEPWWNPFAEEQAMDRAHRIGQTRPVRVVRLAIANTVEERVMKLQEDKRAAAAAASAAAARRRSAASTG